MRPPVIAKTATITSRTRTIFHTRECCVVSSFTLTGIGPSVRGALVLGRREPGLDVRGECLERHILGGVQQAVDELDLALGELFADVDAEGDADQLCVLELDAGAL